MRKEKNIIRLDHVSETVVYGDQFHIQHYADQYPATDKPHRHNYYEILWFPEGKGTHCIDDTCFQLNGGDLFLISEGQMHYFPEAEHLQGYLLLFKDVFWEESLKSIYAFRAILFRH